MDLLYNNQQLAVQSTDINDVRPERVYEFKLLGVEVQDNLKWNSHVKSIVKNARKRIYHVRVCGRAGPPREVGLTIYVTKIRPWLEYRSPIWGGIPRYLATEIERVQERYLRIIGLPKTH